MVACECKGLCQFRGEAGGPSEAASASRRQFPPDPGAALVEFFEFVRSSCEFRLSFLERFLASRLSRREHLF